MAARYTIVDGPSKWEMILSLFDGSTSRRRYVEFTLKMERRDLKKERVMIQEVSRCTDNDTDWRFVCLYNAGVHGIQSAEGVFSTQDREGWIVFPLGYAL